MLGFAIMILGIDTLVLSTWNLRGCRARAPQIRVPLLVCPDCAASGLWVNMRGHRL